MNIIYSWIRCKCWSISIVLASVIAIAFVHRFIVSSVPSDYATPVVEDAVVASPFATVPLTAQLDEVISATRPVLSAEIESLSLAGHYQQAKDRLLDAALQAVAEGDNESLALYLSELGELALLQGDLGMAEVYLAEALELYEQSNDELKLAGVHIQMGRLHLYVRQRARRASDSYDQLLLSRWNISHGRFRESEDTLRQVVDTNLKLNRYGAAASTYETLFRGYSKENDTEAAQLAGIEAIKLHATSGRLHQANRLLDILVDNGMTDFEAEKIARQMEQHHSEYEASIRAIGESRDYVQLYNQLLARGDALQAWRFRRQAEQSLTNATKNAQHRRQADVLVELYRSNTSMSNALTSLQKANAVYSRYGLAEGVKRSRQLREQIY